MKKTLAILVALLFVCSMSCAFAYSWQETVTDTCSEYVVDVTKYAKVVSDVGAAYTAAPTTGNKWAHGKFTTGSTVNVSFSGTFQGAAPSIEANKVYEFDVFDSVWAVQEVVSS